MIQPSFDAALMPAIGRTALPPSRLSTAPLAAVALSPIATVADQEQRAAIRITAMPCSENDSRMNRHRPAMAAFDKRNGS